MKHLFLILILFTFGISQTSQTSEDAEIPHTSSKSNSLVASVEGDLTKDGVPERAEVWQTDRLTNDSSGYTNELRIFRKQKNHWNLWHVSTSPILPSYFNSEEKFESCSIDRGAIVINHYFGGTGMWGTTDRFRFQNGDWYLIGHTESSTWHGEFSCSDFNLSTRKFVITRGRAGNDKTDVQSGTFQLENSIKMDSCFPGTGFGESE